jgi:hypothetical protein
MNKTIKAVAVAAIIVPTLMFGGSKNFVDSKDYKDKEFRKCIIQDYSLLTEADGIDWSWKQSGIKLSDYKISLGSLENKAEKKKASETKAVTKAFADALLDLNENKKSKNITAEVCIYDIDDFSYGKAWIPFAGNYQMQEGIGIEMILKENGQTVAVLRDFSRSGQKIEDAAKKVAENLTEYIGKN